MKFFVALWWSIGARNPKKLGFYSLGKGFFYFMTELKIYLLNSFSIIYDTHPRAFVFLVPHKQRKYFYCLIVNVSFTVSVCSA